jgi:sulfite reductase alpha subunit
VHRPALPYKFKFKISGCPNDCQNAIERADFAVIGTWRDHKKINQDAWKEFVELKGREYVLDNIITRCVSNSLALGDDNTLIADESNCVRSMHCMNVVPKAISPGDDKGVTILMGGKRTLKIGDLMGIVIVPFMKLETEDDYETMVELAEEVIDFWAENGLEHERCGEMIERIGLVNFLEGIGVDPDPNKIHQPRNVSYVRMDGWDEAAEEWFNRKREEKSAA